MKCVAQTHDGPPVTVVSKPHRRRCRPLDRNEIRVHRDRALYHLLSLQGDQAFDLNTLARIFQVTPRTLRLARARIKALEGRRDRAQACA